MVKSEVFGAVVSVAALAVCVFFGVYAIRVSDGLLGFSCGVGCVWFLLLSLVMIYRAWDASERADVSSGEIPSGRLARALRTRNGIG